MIDGDQTPADIGRRITMLREALDLNQAAFSRRVGISQPSIANYESGFRRPELDKAILIAAKTGATLDWIYMGVRSGLPLHLSEKLGEFQRSERQAG